MQKLLTVVEVADLLSVSKQTVYNMASRHEFPAGVVIRIRGCVRFHEGALITWIESGGELGATSEGSK